LNKIKLFFFCFFGFLLGFSYFCIRKCICSRRCIRYRFSLALSFCKYTKCLDKKQRI